MTKTKSFPARVKAAGVEDGLEVGQFEAIVSVFDTVDSYGDVVMPGAFADSLASWAEKGDPIPVIWSHRWDDPEMHIGVVLAAEERPEGLWVRGQIDLDDDAPAKAKQANRLLKGRRVTQFSFAYDVVDGGWGKRDDRDVYELRKLDVHEVGPCLIGVNRDTDLLAAKATPEGATPGLWEAIIAHAKATGQLEALAGLADQTPEAGPPGVTVTINVAGPAEPAASAPEQAAEASEAEPDPSGPTSLSPASALLHADLLDT